MKIKLFLCVSALCMLMSSAYAAEVSFDRDSRAVVIEGNIKSDVSIMLLKPDMTLTGDMSNTEIAQAIENLEEIQPDQQGNITVTLPVADLPDGEIKGNCIVLINGEDCSEHYTVEVFSQEKLDEILQELSDAAGAGEDAEDRISEILSDETKCSILMASEIYANESFRNVLVKTLAEKDLYSSYLEVKTQITKVQDQIDCLDGFNSMLNKVQVYDLIEKLYTVAYEKDEYYTKYMSLSSTSSVDKKVFEGKHYSSLKDVYDTFTSAMNDRPSGGNGGNGGGNGGSGDSGIVVIGPVGTVTQPGEAPQSNGKFKDVPQEHWAYNFIYALEERGVVSGTSEDTFMPEQEITREAFVTMLVLALDIDLSDEVDQFTDTDKNAWYSRYLSTAVQCGLVSGRDDGSFGIGETLSRQDMAVLVMRAAKHTGASIAIKDKVEFADADEISQYAKESVEILSGAGMMNGIGNNYFAPMGITTRSQAARMVYELIRLVEGTV